MLPYSCLFLLWQWKVCVNICCLEAIEIVWLTWNFGFLLLQKANEKTKKSCSKFEWIEWKECGAHLNECFLSLHIAIRFWIRCAFHRNFVDSNTLFTQNVSCFHFFPFFPIFSISISLLFNFFRQLQQKKLDK